MSLPDQIGRFRIRSMLGRGAMGVVYLGHDEEIDRLVAIKLIRADLLDTDERDSYVKRFRNEAKIAGRCMHANIVGLYDFSMHEGNPYLVMEYCHGVGLQQFYPRGSRRGVDEVVSIALQVLDALHYAHGRSIVHRDIKPANILMMPDTTLKITDFGISRLTSMEMTVTPLLIGTPSYMSPEQCIGSTLDGRNDLFSLGCVLYELLAGERAFGGVNYTETLFSIVNRPHAPLSGIRDDLPPGLSDAIDQALAKRPEDRFPDAASFARRLDEIVREAGLDRTNVPAVVTARLRATVARQEEPEGVPSGAADGQGDDGGAVPETLAIPLRNGAPAVPAPEPPADPPVEDDLTVIHASPEAVRAWRPEVEPDATKPAEAEREPEPEPEPEADPVSTELATAPLPEVVEVRNAAAAEPASRFAPAARAETLTVAEREHLSRCLAEIMGPIAPVLVRRTEEPGMDADAMARRLAQYVRHADERATFLALVSHGLPTRTASP